MISFAIGQIGETLAAADQPESDQLTVARLAGAAQRHAPWREATPEETAAAVAELREIADDRSDLLAEAAGLLAGFYAGTAEDGKARTAARYCRLAGADPDLIPRWTAEGERRAAFARGPRQAGYVTARRGRSRR
jgi:acyl-CoA reductase-like NAD-dependent aldehyde dehydrogenase